MIENVPVPVILDQLGWLGAAAGLWLLASLLRFARAVTRNRLGSTLRLLSGRFGDPITWLLAAFVWSGLLVVIALVARHEADMITTSPQVASMEIIWVMSSLDADGTAMMDTARNLQHAPELVALQASRVTNMGRFALAAAALSLPRCEV